MQTPPSQVDHRARAVSDAVHHGAGRRRDQDGSRVDPYLAGQISDVQAIEVGADPAQALHAAADAGGGSQAVLRRHQHAPSRRRADDVPMRMAMPAFMVSELTTAFQMGVIILLPFLVVDLAVASLLMSMGMMMVPPTTHQFADQAAAVRARRRLEPGRRLSAQELHVTSMAPSSCSSNAIMWPAWWPGPAVVALLVGLVVGVLAGRDPGQRGEHQLRRQADRDWARPSPCSAPGRCRSWSTTPSRTIASISNVTR